MRYVYFVLIYFVSAQLAVGCPFCSALSSTLREEFEQVDFVAIASCTKLASKDSDFPIHTFLIRQLLQGQHERGPDRELLRLAGSEIKGYSRQSFRVGEDTLLLGIKDSDDIAWAPSAQLSHAALEYIEGIFRLRQLSAEGSSSHWLDYYWEHLDSEDEWIRADAYNGLAPVAVKELRPWSKRIHRDEVKSRISQQSTSKSHRRFYWTILGLAGTPADADFAFATISRQLNRRLKNPLAVDTIGMDAAISCYMLLGGEAALKVIERDFLTDSKRHDSELFATLAALRVHTEEFDVFEKKRICQSLAILLDNPDLADQVIPDLARLEEWSYVERLTKLFVQAKPEHQYVRVPIINYLRACPLPSAKEALAQCKELAPDAYRRANIIFPFATKKAGDK